METFFCIIEDDIFLRKDVILFSLIYSPKLIGYSYNPS